MLNVLSVLLVLSEKVNLDKVSDNYLFHPKSRLPLEDETRFKSGTKDVEEYSQNTAFCDDDIKFPTECFFMTIQAIRLGLNASIESFKHLKRTCSDLRQALKELTEQQRQAEAMPGSSILKSRLSAKINQLKGVYKKCSLMLANLECSLSDTGFLDRCVDFLNKQMHFLLRALNSAWYVLFFIIFTVTFF